MIDDRLTGEDPPVDRKYKCPTCGFKTITDCPLMCPECRDQLEPAETGEKRR
jgi:rubrerythrin